MRALVARVGSGPMVVEVGVLGPKAAKARGKVTIGQIATWLEFGTSRQPARPAIRSWFDKNAQANQDFAKRLAERRLRGQLTVEQSLQQIGAYAVGGIQKHIAAGITPPNALSTIRKKGSSKPWIDTGQTRASFSFRIRK